DIEAPEIAAADTQTQVQHQAALQTIDETDLNSDLNQIDKKSTALAAIEQNKFQQETSETSNDLNQQLDKAESNTQLENAQLADKAQNYQLAAQQARANALKDAENRRQGALAAANAEAAARSTKNIGRGNNGSTQGQQNSLGSSPQSARALNQIRQKPGNPLPQYSREERLQRQSGKAIFVAFINADGGISQFKLVQSTGYRSLDSKTLQALKKWKFYPGQEGWVELPFIWDLKGGVQEMPTLLRVKGRNIGNL
ncbi:MAG: energy transducer TonB, partial [Pseudobdellovibrionaceae bacterium]